MARSRHANRPGFRFCNRCDKEFPLDLEHFVGDNSRPGGCGYECRLCQRARKRGRDFRTDRWSLMTPAQRVKAKARQNRYNNSHGGRPRMMAHRYRYIDRQKGLSCDLTREFLADLVLQPCFYCGDTSERRGADRISNLFGHNMNNVVPCCGTCNSARMDNFTHDEMKILGQTIARLKAARLEKAA